MMNKYEYQNTHIYERFKAAEKRHNTTEMHAAKNDYDENIKRQKEMLADMPDKNCEEYRKLEDSIHEQEEKSKEMARSLQQEYSHEGEKVDDLERLKRENQQISEKMDAAIRKGDTKAYDELRQKYETNIKAQDNISQSLKTNGIKHENTTDLQNINKRNMDNDMADKFRDKMQERADKGKKPDPRDKEQYDKYMKLTRQSEQEDLKRIDDKKLENMKNYGLSDEEINKARHEMEHDRERYR